MFSYDTQEQFLFISIIIILYLFLKYPGYTTNNPLPSYRNNLRGTETTLAAEMTAIVETDKPKVKKVKHKKVLTIEPPKSTTLKKVVITTTTGRKVETPAPKVAEPQVSSEGKIHVPEVTANQNSESGPLFAPYNIAKNPSLEALNCARLSYDCKDYPETTTNWPRIPPTTFKTSIGQKYKHTNPMKSSIEITKNSCTADGNDEIIVQIQSKDALGGLKTHGGDYWQARLTPFEEDEYKKYELTNGTFGTYFPGNRIDHNDGTYTIKIPCIIPGQYKVQVFLIRTAEAQEATIRAMAGVNPKSRAFKGTVNGEKVNQCGPLLPEMLADAEKKEDFCVINSVPGREWYCKKPRKVGCGKLDYLNFDARAWNFGDTLKPLHLDDVYEDLSFTGDVEVQEASGRPASDPSPLPPSIKGYWQNSKWHDTQIPKFSQNIKKHNVLKDKVFIIMGDSLSAQFMTDFKGAIEKFARDVLHRGKGKFKCSKQEYGFLGIVKGDKCPKDPGPWAPNIFHCPTTNTTFVRLPHGMPIHKDGCVETAQYTGDMLEQMVKENWVGPEYIILMTHGAHFAAFNPIVFYKRLEDIKKSVQKYKEKSPGSLIIFKTLNYIRGDFRKLWSTVSSFNAWRQREMAFKVFGDPKLVDMRKPEQQIKVFDVWPMTELAFDHMDVGNVHPGWGKSPDWMLNEIIDYFVDFLHFLEYI